jgi:hypothetical protein
MRKTVVIISIFALIAGGCGQSNAKNKNNVETHNDTLQNSSLPEKNKGQEEWNFIISPPNVGLISTKNHISEISDLLPPNYHIAIDSISYDYEESYDIFYAVRKDNKTIFEIYSDDNNGEIRSIAVLSPEYKIKNTELRVGSTLGELKKTFSIKDWNYNFDWGLYVYCNEFNGTFKIDIGKNGSDKPDFFESLPDSKKIEIIVVYR